MNIFENIIVTDIHTPIFVVSEKGRSFEMVNREYFGLSFCSDGQITYTMNGKKYVSTKNTAMLLPRGSTYSLIGDKDGIFPVVNFLCNNFNSDEIVVFPLTNPSLCIKILDNIKNLCNKKENRLEVLSEFYKLLNQITSQNSAKTNTLTPIMKYIEQNLTDTSLSNTKLAKRLNISEVYLRKLFLKHYNVTPKQFILEARIQKAKQMLIETPYSVTQIALDSGFSNPFHFCRTFKEKTGYTPLEYSKKYKVFEI